MPDLLRAIHRLALTRIYHLGLVVLWCSILAATITGDDLLAYFGLGYAILLVAYALIFDRRRVVTAYRYWTRRLHRLARRLEEEAERRRDA